jgi:hypothetical protein
MAMLSNYTAEMDPVYRSCKAEISETCVVTVVSIRVNPSINQLINHSTNQQLLKLLLPGIYLLRFWWQSQFLLSNSA